MTEEAAYRKFCELRWASTQGEPVCPHCGVLDHYKIATRRRFKCAGCGKQYSVTSGTIFASRKMTFAKIVEGLSGLIDAAHQWPTTTATAHSLGVQQKTAWDFQRRVRKILSKDLKDGHPPLSA